MDYDKLRNEIIEFLGFHISAGPVLFQKVAEIEERDYIRQTISYQGWEGDKIRAFLLVPKYANEPYPAVLIHHQNSGRENLGKSEVCGLAGDPLQAFGPSLAKRGIMVLAPDSICFEDRRRNCSGIEPDEPNDWLQHYNEMSYRLLVGETLMHKVLNDSATAISVLESHSMVDHQKIGIMGHSYGGNTALFHAALDQRINFTCASGAAATYKNKMINGTGIEMAEIIPDFMKHYDIPDLVKCLAPRKSLLVSATDDAYSKDAGFIVDSAKAAFAKQGAEACLEHKRFSGGHSLTAERFKYILEWLVLCCQPVAQKQHKHVEIDE